MPKWHFLRKKEPSPERKYRNKCHFGISYDLVCEKLMKVCKYLKKISNTKVYRRIFFHAINFFLLSKIFYIYPNEIWIYYLMFNKINVPWTETSIKIKKIKKRDHLWHECWIHILTNKHAKNNIITYEALLW